MRRTGATGAGRWRTGAAGTALLLVITGLALVVGEQGDGVPNGYGAAGRRYLPAVASRYGAVASASADASAAGIAVLAGGGNAVDAAVATVFAVGVAAQESCGIGGGGFLLSRGADGTVAALDFRETAPSGLPAAFEAAPRRFSGAGHQVVGVPGTVAGMAAVAERYGSWPWARLLAPAIALAGRGVRLTAFQVEVLEAARDRLAGNDAASALYLDDGRVPAPYPAGPERVQADLARTLRTLAVEGPSAVYRGTIAAAIVAEMERSRTLAVPDGEKGVMTAADLAAYRPVWREPLRGSYRGREILAMPPPTSGGILVVELLNLLEGFDLPARGRTDLRHSSANHLHLLAEAKKITVADRNAHVADPDFVDLPTGRLVSKEYADTRRAEIDPKTAQDYRPGAFSGSPARPAPGTADGGPATGVPAVGGPTGAAAGGPAQGGPVDGRAAVDGHSGGSEPSSTHHISVVDAAGNAVAVTCTVEQRYGSAVVVPDTGILLNNQLTDFDGPGTVNEPAPGKRPRSSMSPVIVVDDDRPALVLGASGGLRIPMGVASVISNVVDHGMDPARAVDVARADAERCCALELEHTRVPATERRELERRGHRVEGRGQYHPLFVPLVQVAGVDRSGRTFAVSDPRYDRGAAAVAAPPPDR